MNERVEPLLLLEHVRAGRPRCLALERQVHAFVAAVLLGMTWLDSLVAYAQPTPPDRESAQ
jgi:hypothetical protein